jgi:hypothetical protein
MINGFLARKLVAASTGNGCELQKHREKGREAEHPFLSHFHIHSYSLTQYFLANPTFLALRAMYKWFVV